MSECYTKEWCPKCSTKNWVYLGDLDDITGCDTHGCICYKCGHKWIFEGVDLMEDEEPTYADGTENP
jgi:hypothetical protein